MNRRSEHTARRAGLIAVAAGLAAALVAVGARLAGRPRGALARLRNREEQEYRCRCGAVYRVSGTDRHRVYWPAGASRDDPVLGDRCVQCDAPLPAGG